MKYRKQRRIFLGVLALVFVVDSIFDFLALRQSFIIENTEQEILASQQILVRLDAMNLSLFKMHGNPPLQSWSTHETTSFKDNLHQYLGLIENDHPTRPHFERLRASVERNALKFIMSNSEKIYDLIKDSRHLEQLRQSTKLISEAESNRASRIQIIAASILDLLLLAAIALIWISYDRSRRQNEIALTNSIQSAEATIAELNRVLKRKTLELRSTVHDLKNPLGSIKGFSDLIEEECSNPKSVAEMSHAVKRLSDHTLALVNSLLELESKSTSIETEARIVNVVAYIEDVIYSLKPQLTKKHQRVQFQFAEKTIEVFGDPKKIWDVLMNLIENAVKYSPLYSKISLKIFQRNSIAVIQIEDEGPGFSDQDKAKAFNEFAVLSAKPTGEEIGTGMGLKAACDAVRTLGGQITILDKKNGHGAVVQLELPMRFGATANHALTTIPI